jgi:calcineurin-like phosphoesterase family protein
VKQYGTGISGAFFVALLINLGYNQHMKTKFVISDLHLGHTNICKFLRSDGITKVRPWDNTDVMNEAIIENWNRVVGPNDIVYNLGDVVINRRYLELLSRLNGEQHLILGNHDIFHHSDYAKYFYRICGSVKLDNYILSHYPVHVDSITHRRNIHGHLHDTDIPDSRYFNVSVENINYTPVSLDELKILIQNKQNSLQET